MSAPSPDIDPLVKQFQSLQEQTQALVMGRQNFLSRLNENKMVQEVRCVLHRRLPPRVPPLALLSLPPHTTTLLPLAPHPHPRPHLHYRIAQELERLNDDSNVFKLIGPVLVKQDVDDAKATVASRLELIERELCVLSHRVLTRCPQTFPFQRAPLPFPTHCFSALTSRSTPSHIHTAANALGLKSSRRRRIR